VAYPDPLAGLRGAAAALALLAARDLGRGGIHAEVSLYAAARPLLAVPDRGHLRRHLNGGLLRRLTAAAGVPPRSPLRTEDR
jgi:hypothetical protein